MSSSGKDAETIQDDVIKASTVNVIEHSEPSRRRNSLLTTPQLQGRSKATPSPEANANTFLPVPLSGPIRPLSPDTLSVLSTDEYDQIRPLGSLYGDGNEHLPPPTDLSPWGWRSRLRAIWIRNKGLSFVLIAQIFGTLMNVTTRLLEIEGNRGKGLHPFQILFARMSITVVLSITYMWYNSTPDWPLGKKQVRWLLVARGFGGFFGVFGMYSSLLYLPLADATVITFLAPGLACWACSILINEPFGRMEQIAGLVSLVGVVLIARPTSLLAAFGGSGESTSAVSNGGQVASLLGNSTTSAPASDAASYDSVSASQRLTGVGVGLLGVLGSAVAFTTIRWIGTRAHPLISVTYFSTWCTFVSLVAMFTLPGVGFLLPQELKEWCYLIFLGLCGFIMQFLLAAGLSYEKSSRATNITYMQMLFALAFDKLIFNHTPDALSIAGSALILGSAICVAAMANAGSAGGTRNELAQDDEAQEGLVNEVAHERRVANGEMPVQELQMRVLRQG
ncbi:EamA-like transporter family [Teratosphaeria destructans]|uniref:EamA-like transporter family n=1 Tax=Teratosphaeria destructans TaxID=418781 RepID=A0A9W7SK05_9PEZI|nr:EamA-like transporter family [Teratosphaeria destructans]